MPEYQSCYTVSNLNSQIRNLLEGSLSDIWVKGEISNFHHHPSSGHMYFTLKDENGELRCAMFRGNNQYLKFKPEDAKIRPELVEVSPNHWVQLSRSSVKDFDKFSHLVDY